MMEIVLYFLGVILGIYGFGTLCASVGVVIGGFYATDLTKPLEDCDKLLNESLIALLLSIITLLYVGGYFNV